MSTAVPPTSTGGAAAAHAPEATSLHLTFRVEAAAVGGLTLGVAPAAGDHHASASERRVRGGSRGGSASVLLAAGQKTCVPLRLTASKSPPGGSGRSSGSGSGRSSWREDEAGEQLRLTEEQCPLSFAVLLTARLAHWNESSQNGGSSQYVGAGEQTLRVPVTLRCRQSKQSFVFTFIDHDGSVGRAAAIAPLHPSVPSEPSSPAPVMVSLHGTGVDPSNQVPLPAIPPCHVCSSWSCVHFWVSWFTCVCTHCMLA